MLTDADIKERIAKFAESSMRRLEIRENSPRKSRVFLLLRKAGRDGTRIFAEWYAVYYRGRSRQLIKLGNYPTITLSAARAAFQDAQSADRPESLPDDVTPEAIRTRTNLTRGEAVILTMLRDLMSALRIETTIDPETIDALIAEAEQA